MDINQIRTQINSDPSLIALIPDTQAIANQLSVGKTKLVKTSIGRGDILSVLGLTKGNIFLDLVQNTVEYRHVWPLIQEGRLDISNPIVRDGINQFVVANVLTQAEADSLLALGTEVDSISELDVRKAIWNDSGERMV